jgi:sigma-B regulation protein RsbU (phosphoserine phosphatase)
MKYFDEHPRVVRFLVGVLTVYLFALAVVTFYRYTSAPTDENWFRDSKSVLYVVKSLSATAVTKSSNQPFTRYSGSAADSIRVGDLVMRINDIAPRSQADIENIMRSASSDSVFTIVVDRSTENAKIVFKAKRSAIPGGDYVRTIPPTAYVYDVIENGASDHAGMKAGDLILRINGKGFASVNEASVILGQGQIGKSIEYEVLRANKTLTLNVTLASWGLPISILIVFMSGLLYMTVGVFIAMKRPQLKAARLTGLAFLSLGFVMVVVLLQGNISAEFFVRLRSITLAFSLFIGIALLFHSRHYFPKERPELLARPWILGISYVLAASSIVLAFIEKGTSALIGVAAMMLYFTGITIYFWKQCSLEYKKLARLISWTGIVSFGIAIALGFLINATQNQAYFGYIGAALALFPLAYLYSIGRYRLLDLDLRVRRNIQYSIISWLWIVVLAALSFEILFTLPQAKMNLPNIRLTGASIEILNTPSLPGQQEPFEKAVLMATAVILTLVIGFVGKRGQAIIATLYDRARYDYRRAANELAEVMGTKLGMVDLARGIVEKLSELMKLKRAGVIFFRDECSCCCTETQGFDGTAWKIFCMMSDKKLVEAIQKFKGEFSVDYLPTAIKENFRQQEFQYVIPIRSKEKLIGALFVGEKLSESTFRQEDLELLSSTAKQASVAIENAFLYEELAEQDRIKHELDMARRIQEGLLPKKNPVMRGLDISGISIPAMSVGGDYFDYIPLGRKKLLVVVADVSGKGMSAALYMSKIQGMVQLAAHMYKTPKEMLIHINRRIFEGLERKSFITMILAVFDLQKKEVRICRAGHNKALISTNGKLHYLNAHGIGLGLERGKIFEEELQEIRKPLSKDGIFVFYSDGLTEAMDGQNNQFGEETVHSIVESNRHLRAEELQHSILSSVDKFRGGAEPHDDLTLVVVKTAK